MIPFSPPRIDQKILDEVCNALQSGWITTGPRTKEFEKRLKEYCKVSAVLALNSATAGLELMLRWFGVKEGDEVILPAYTYAATANVIVHCGAKPVFVDVADDFNIAVNAIKNAITKNTKVIMPVDIAGMPCDYDEINMLVRTTEIKNLFTPHNDEQKTLGRILVLSDAAHSVGALYKGRKTGSLADTSVFSFHAVKNLTTAEGGAVCLCLPEPFNNEDIYKKLNIKILHGQNKDALAKTQAGNWKYDVIEAGYKWNMTDILASIGLVELARYDSETLLRRKEIFDYYANALSAYTWAKVPVYETGEKISSYHIFLLRINNIREEQRDEIIQQIFAKEVSVNVHFRPLPMMTFYKGMGYKIEDYPTAYANFACEITLPVYYNLTKFQLKQIVDAIISSVENVVKKN